VSHLRPKDVIFVFSVGGGNRIVTEMVVRAKEVPRAPGLLET
jgi:DNA-binding MurR/RpiR family transcriptional regulator